METVKIDVGRDEARDLYRKYKTHRHYDEPMDWEIQRTYQLIAQGHVVIRALESIKAAGVDEAGRPRLAIAAADADVCRCDVRYDGGATMRSRDGWPRSNERNMFRFSTGTFPRRPSARSLRAIRPMIPAHLRPKRGIANYHILWEADWEDIPVDPYLLRRIGKGDLWLVCAAWDLTEVERAVMAARVNAA